uniref:Flagellar FliJ protein n=1 Tax=Tanacetum cinerariifolium TaxID=118510 RepID=A0A699H0V2_TANCI|nr:hypothetical protein [Tanacetum cinerariifolium]
MMKTRVGEKDINSVGERSSGSDLLMGESSESDLLIFSRVFGFQARIPTDDIKKAYDKCNDILQESRALIDTFLKEGSDKDYELYLSMYGKAVDLYLAEKELHQLHLDEEALRETLEEKAMDEKAREEKIRQKQADDEEFFMEFGVVRYDSEYESSD